jgi:transposase
MNDKLKLSRKERDLLKKFKKIGDHSLREFNRATVLTFLDKGLSISEIENLLEVDRTTIWRIKQRYHEYGLELALIEKERPGQPLKYTRDHEAKLIALICGPSPEGRSRWTIRLLVEELRKQRGFETITYSSVRMMLKKSNSSLG